MNKYMNIKDVRMEKGLVTAFPCSRVPGSRDAGGLPHHLRPGTRALGPAARKWCYQPFFILLNSYIHIFVHLYPRLPAPD